MASKNRKTKVLSYNLHDRCRKFTGVDRSNVDVDAMVNLINSDHVQEMVATNSLQGFTVIKFDSAMVWCRLKR